MPPQSTILIVDDEKHTRDGLRRLLEDEYDTYVAEDIRGAMDVLEREQIDLMVTDLRLGSDDGMALIERALKLPQPPICIMMTAYGSVDTAVEAMKRGAYDFVTKPINLDKLEILIRRALRSREMETENTALKEQVQKNYGLENIIGHSAVMEAIFATIRQVAPTRATVSISGESGTGKELVAHALHNLSNRAKSKFVAVNCAALAPQLLESELFGHEKGSFTGASERRAGRFEEAHHGTIFLDEIGEIDAATQVKLLRALGEQTIQRVGSNQNIKVDVRVVAATNKNLETMVREGKFRDDLFYRLDVVPIHLPPLRERREDIPLLINAFVQEFATQNHKRITGLSADAQEALQRYEWPGNIRELRAALEHAVALCRGERIGVRDLPSRILGKPGDAAGAAKGRSLPGGEAYFSPSHLNLEAMEK